MYQVRKILTLAASRLGAINYGENLDQNSSQTLLDILQMMMDEFSIRTLNYKQYDQTVTAKNEILIGTDTITSTSGDILERPAEIKEVIVKIGQLNYPQVLKTYEEYRQIPMVNVNAIPNICYIRYDFPFITLNFFPGFGQSASVQVIGRSYITVSDLEVNDYMEVKREFIQGVVSNLALRSAGFFGIPVDQSLVIEASSALKHIKQRQLIESMSTLKNDLYGDRGYNFYSGMSR